jgi:hypothetical protein
MIPTGKSSKKEGCTEFGEWKLKNLPDIKTRLVPAGTTFGFRDQVIRPVVYE